MPTWGVQNAQSYILFHVVALISLYSKLIGDGTSEELCNNEGDLAFLVVVLGRK